MDEPLSILIEKAVERGVAIALAQRPRPSFLTKEQAAEILGVTPRTVNNMIADGRIRVGSSGKIAILPENPWCPSGAPNFQH